MYEAEQNHNPDLSVTQGLGKRLNASLGDNSPDTFAVHASPEQKLLNSKNYKDDIDLLVSLHGLCSIGLGPDDHAPAVEGHGVLPDTASGLALADCLDNPRSNLGDNPLVIYIPI